MPVSTSGRIIKTRKKKGGTAHQKNHRWESFTVKISKLNSLDPLRKVRRHDIEPENLSTDSSYLKDGFRKWEELNMSEMYTKFSREVAPMCDSLPQIIHFEDRIMEKFVLYIEKRERESLEPLLELVTDFSHDLGHRFEKHYPKFLGMITSIAGTFHDVAVIEWCFTSLAFMFKYLARLLVPDLRPTYDLMAPLLGKQKQRPHIARFAAEALSFLVKKAGAPAHREKALMLILSHAKKDLSQAKNTKEFGLYYHGIMTLFAEAIKGHGLNTHTSGPGILRLMFRILDHQDLNLKEMSPWMNVICGVLTSILHHTNIETFEPILDVVIELADESEREFSESDSVPNLCRALLSARTIGICAGVRKGSRIRNWTGLIRSLQKIFQSVAFKSTNIYEADSQVDLWGSLILSFAIILQYVPLDLIIGSISPFLDALTKESMSHYFLVFCSYISETEPERFCSILIPYFQRYVCRNESIRCKF